MNLKTEDPITRIKNNAFDIKCGENHAYFQISCEAFDEIRKVFATGEIKRLRDSDEKEEFTSLYGSNADFKRYVVLRRHASNKIFVNSKALFEAAFKGGEVTQTDVSSYLVFDRSRFLSDAEATQVLNFANSISTFVDSLKAYPTSSSGVSAKVVTTPLHQFETHDLIIEFRSENDECYFDSFIDLISAKIPSPFRADDNHYTEKVHLYRKALCFVFSHRDRITVTELVKLIDLVSRKFSEELTHYLGKFGLDDKVNEVIEERYKFISKINQELTSTANRFIGVPIAIGATTLLRSSDNIGIKVFVILLTSAIFFFMISDVFKQSITKQAEEAHRIINTFTEGKDPKKKLKAELDQFSRSITDSVNSAKNRINLLLLGSGLAFVIWFFIVVCEQATVK